VPYTSTSAAAAKHRTSAARVSGETLAEAEMQRGAYHGNCGYVTRAAEAFAEARVDGVIWNYLYNCRPVAETAYLLKHFVEKETGIPVLLVEADLADSRNHSAGAIRTRVETFAEMLRARKALKV